MSAAAARRRKQLLKKQQANAASGDPVNARLQTLLAGDEDSGESVAYEALQLAQSQIRRLEKQNQPDEAVKLAIDVSMTLLEKKDRMVSVASQLLGLLAEILNESQTDCTDESVTKMVKLDSAYKKALKDGYDMKCDKDKEEVERLQRLHMSFLKKIARWSIERGTIQHGNMTLHSLVGEQCWIVGLHSQSTDQDDEEAQEAIHERRAESVVHLALAEKPQRIFELLKTLPSPTKDEESMGRNGGTAAERDLLLTRSVLVFIALENLRDANALLSSYVNDIPHDRSIETLAKSYMNKTDGFAPSHIMFCNMLLQICEKERAGPLFQWLLKNFNKELQTLKPDVKPYTTKIGRVYFGIMPPPSMLNMMENMMGMMGGAGGNPMAAMAAMQGAM